MEKASVERSWSDIQVSPSRLSKRISYLTNIKPDFVWGCTVGVVCYQGCYLNSRFHGEMHYIFEKLMVKGGVVCVCVVSGIGGGILVV